MLSWPAIRAPGSYSARWVGQVRVRVHAHMSATLPIPDSLTVLDFLKNYVVTLLLRDSLLCYACENKANLNCALGSVKFVILCKEKYFDFCKMKIFIVSYHNSACWLMAKTKAIDRIPTYLTLSFSVLTALYALPMHFNPIPL